jgi:Tol biopolymer transport system component
MKLKIWTAGLVLALAALAAESGGELYQKAVTAERAGKMEDAIKLYEKVAHDFASDRPLAAKALMQAARGYEKLGQDKAAKVYEQIEREYADQREYVDAARVRLAALKPTAPPTMALRKIEFGEGIQNIAGTDGQRVVYWDADQTTLFFGDVAGKNKQVVYKAPSGIRPTAYPSRDLSMVLLELSPTGPYAVVRTDGTGYREIPLRFQRSPAIGGLRWSWDSRYVLRIESEADASARLQRISVADGQVSDVVPNWKEGIQWAAFSPDGRFIAFGELVENTILRFGPAYVVPAQGGEPHLVAESAGGGDWTRDGKYLLIDAERAGATALFALPIQNGQAAGERVFIRNLDAGYPVGTTPSGALALQSIPLVFMQTLLATVDGQGKIGAWKPLDLIGNAFAPEWSPDGGRIAYVSVEQLDRLSRGVIRVYDVSSGQDRELYRSSGNLFNCVWAHQHPSLYCAVNSGARADILSVSLDSGQAEKVGSLEGVRALRLLSSDDRMLHTVKFQGATVGSWWEIGTDREIAGEGRPCEGGRWSYSSVRATDKGRELAIRPQAGGEWKHLTYLKTPVGSAVIRATDACTPDGNWIVYVDRDASGGEGLYRISTAGGEPERLGDYVPGGLNWIEVSSRGQILVMASILSKAPELWLLENFEPKQTAGR